MRIALVLSSTPGYSETFFVSKIKGLQERGHMVTLYVQRKETGFTLCKAVEAPKVYRNSIAQVFSMVGVIASLFFYFGRMKRFVTLERQHGASWTLVLKRLYLNAHMLKATADWLHFGFATQTLGSEFVAKAIGAKMGVSFRGFDIAIYPLKHPGCYKKLWNQLDKVHTISNDLLNRAYELGLPKTVEVQKITPAIDVSVFTPKLSSANSPTVRFLTVARMHWKKGLVDTLQALAVFKQLGIPFKYTIVGDGNTKEWERVAIAIRDLALEAEVILMGKQDKEQVVQHYKNSDVYLQYSISEGFCNAVLEAQASRLLCVVSDAEGLSENVLHEKTGWVVPKSTPKLLAKQLTKTVNMSVSEKDIIRDAARSRVEKHFNIEKQQAEFVQFYTT